MSHYLEGTWYPMCIVCGGDVDPDSDYPGYKCTCNLYIHNCCVKSHKCEGSVKGL